MSERLFWTAIVRQKRHLLEGALITAVFAFLSMVLSSKFLGWLAVVAACAVLLFIVAIAWRPNADIEME